MGHAVSILFFGIRINSLFALFLDPVHIGLPYLTSDRDRMTDMRR